MKKLLALMLVLAFAAACLLAAVGLELWHYARQPAAAAGTVQAVTIPDGQGVGRIAARLAEAGIVRDALKFRLLARFRGQDTRLQAGQYRLSPAMPPAQVLDTLVRGRVHLRRVTVPEGVNLVQIASLMEAAGLVSAAEFEAAAADPELLRRERIPADSFEGYLFPDTYRFPAAVTAAGIIRAMVARFRDVYDPARRRRTAAMGWTVHQVVTLASIIEKETAVAAERPLISAVFHNRLRRGMRLETDPTVIYGIEDFDGNLTRRHLATPTPYNTYRIRGLPPGPIASPGAAAIDAALHPADSEHLFFVARRDGTHQFSTTLAEHNRAVRKYQLGQ